MYVSLGTNDNVIGYFLPLVAASATKSKFDIVRLLMFQVVLAPEGIITVTSLVSPTSNIHVKIVFTPSSLVSKWPSGLKVNSDPIVMAPPSADRTFQAVLVNISYRVFDRHWVRTSADKTRASIVSRRVIE